MIPALFALLVAFPAYAGRIVSYEVDIRAQEDGSLRVHETILYDFDEGRREDIHRDLPLVLHEPPLGTRRLSLRLLEVRRDGRRVRSWYERLRNRRGEPFLRWHLGRPGKRATGRHRYSFRYRVKGALFALDEDHDVFIWHAPGREWNVPMNEVRVVFHFPASWLSRRDAGQRGLSAHLSARLSPAEREAFHVQYFADGHGGCEMYGVACTQWKSSRDGVSSMMMVFGLAPHEGVAIQARFLRKVQWEGKLASPEVKNAVLWFLGFLALFLIALASYGRALARRPKVGAVPVRHAPPEGVDAAMAWVLMGSPSEGNPLVAMLLDLVRKGFVRLHAPKERGEDDVPLLLLAREPSEWTRLSETQRSLLGLLFPGDAKVCIPQKMRHRDGWALQWARFARQVVRLCKQQRLVTDPGPGWAPLFFAGGWIVGLWAWAGAWQLKDLVHGEARSLLSFLDGQSSLLMFLLMFYFLGRDGEDKSMFHAGSVFLAVLEILFLIVFPGSERIGSYADIFDPALLRNPLVLLGAVLTVSMGPMLAVSFAWIAKSFHVAGSPVPTSTYRAKELVRELWGFRRFLEQADEGYLDRLFAEDFEHLPPELPYAVAFGITDGWVQRLSRLLGPEEVHSGRTSISIS